MLMRKTLLTLSIAVAMAVAGCDRTDQGQTRRRRRTAADAPTDAGVGNAARVLAGRFQATGRTSHTIDPGHPRRAGKAAVISDDRQQAGAGFRRRRWPSSTRSPAISASGFARTTRPPRSSRGYAGNSFLFDMKLGIDSPAGLRTARWIGNSADFDPDAGIFLGGYRNPYRPEDVQMTFSGSPDDLSIYVEGTFSHADPKDPFGPPETVKVHGTVNVAQPTPAK